MVVGSRPAFFFASMSAAILAAVALAFSASLAAKAAFSGSAAAGEALLLDTGLRLRLRGSWSLSAGDLERRLGSLSSKRERRGSSTSKRERFLSDMTTVAQPESTMLMIICCSPEMADGESKGKFKVLAARADHLSSPASDVSLSRPQP